eukprot:4172602-Pleurochrysis_carterae.AAC.1
MFVTSILATRMRILQCVLQDVMPYHVDYRLACNPNRDPKCVLQSVVPYSVCYCKRACNSNEYPIMRATKRDAPQYRLQTSL